MREMLFRAKKKNWRELPKEGWWVEGYPVKYQPCASKDEYVYGIVPTYASALYIIEIDPETLCQYARLKDNNDNRIWENDIVLLREEIQDYEWKATVKFGNPNCEYNWGWQLVPIGECDMNKDILLWIDMEIASCEVVGNIFDNPELLEGETE